MLFDITGLLQWYAYFRHPSGVERVTERILGSSPISRNPRIGLVARVLGSNEFFLVDKGLVADLCDLKTRECAIFRLRRIFAQSMRLATLQELMRDGRTFHLPYIALGRLGLEAAVEIWFSHRLGGHSADLESLVNLGSEDVIVNLGDYWCHAGYVDALTRLKTDTGVRLVQFIHDVFAVERPEWANPASAAIIIGQLQKLAQHVDYWLTNSEFVRSTLRQYLAARSIPEKPCSVVPIGSNSFGQAVPIHAGQDRIVLEKYGLADRRYILHVGTVEPRKNLIALLDALAQLRAQGLEVPHCTFVGRTGWKSQAFRHRLRDTRCELGTVSWFKNVSDSELPALYRGAYFTVSPSFAEGWGLPVQESLSQGVPCLAARVGGLPEAGQELAQYFDPSERGGLEVALARWLNNPAAVATARAKIAKQLHENTQPSWQDSAEAILNVVASL